MTKHFVPRGFKKFLPSAEPIEGNDSSLVTFRLLLEIAQISKKHGIFRGTVIDVEKLQEKLDKSEKVRNFSKFSSKPILICCHFRCELQQTAS